MLELAEILRSAYCSAILKNASKTIQGLKKSYGYLFGQT